MEVIATKLASSDETVAEYMARTLLFHSMDHEELGSMVETTMAELQTMGLIIRKSDGEYSATLLGEAIVASSLTPSDGIFVHEELQKALASFVMNGDMHVSSPDSA